MAEIIISGAALYTAVHEGKPVQLVLNGKVYEVKAAFLGRGSDVSFKVRRLPKVKLKGVSDD